MAAKAILAPKPNSFQFEDRVLELGGGAAVRVGRAHKEDKADSDNGYFDCKVELQTKVREDYVKFHNHGEHPSPCGPPFEALLQGAVPQPCEPQLGGGQVLRPGHRQQQRHIRQQHPPEQVRRGEQGLGPCRYNQ